jgi:hypothetical protein
MGLEVGGVLYWTCGVSVLVLASSCGHCGGVLGPVLIVVGPWCSFIVLAVVGMGNGSALSWNSV